MNKVFGAMEMLSISEFYHGQDVFITGATGLIGKVVIEKLLRSCSDVRNIYILVRNKRGKSCEQRVQEMIDIPLFEKLKNDNPKCFNKIVPIHGDAKEVQLGIADEDLHLLKDVSIIYHTAASVRFDDRLRDAILLNTRGTRELMNIALGMRNVKAIIHVSTMYCNPDHTYIEEKLYRPHMDYNKAIEIATKVDDNVLDILTSHFSDHFPNTYTFTKGLAEQVCDAYKDRLPILIYRPAIVSGTRMDPIPGWVDSFNGTAGFVIASYTGMARAVNCNDKAPINCIPLDDCVRGMIVGSWKLGSMQNKTKELHIVNCTSPIVMTYKSMISIGTILNMHAPYSSVLWPATGYCIDNKVAYWCYIMIAMVIPAVCADFFFRRIGREPFVLKLQRKIYLTLNSLSLFIQSPWVFRIENFEALNNSILPSDRDDFCFVVRDINVKEYLKWQILGHRRYLLKEDDSTIPAARKKMRFLITVDYLLQILFWCVVAYFLARYFFL